jgi:hypothetical protein
VNTSFKYSPGTVNGELAYDLVSVGESPKINFEMLFATKEKGFGTTSDGIMGLSNNLKYYNLFDVGYLTQDFTTPRFGIAI